MVGQALTALQMLVRVARHPRESRDPAIVRAAQWLADQGRPQHSITIELQSRFGLAHVHAREAHDLAGRMRILRRAFG
ncbi:hypothetical protein FHX10_004558 [Rhizobium sp. BK591]|uniref:hypothetical protein n=1 Tax=Rhizobium sp. BK591 TaxID=2586985 RepID=UPI0016125CDC|nr:hypothetical protein [Rhizobium sp. BK591]MBB3745021.1 hypothetical protein [Rhizobium sp. BK591]